MLTGLSQKNTETRPCIHISRFTCAPHNLFKKSRARFFSLKAGFFQGPTNEHSFFFGHKNWSASIGNRAQHSTSTPRENNGRKDGEGATQPSDKDNARVCVTFLSHVRGSETTEGRGWSERDRVTTPPCYHLRSDRCTDTEPELAPWAGGKQRFSVVWVKRTKGECTNFTPYHRGWLTLLSETLRHCVDSLCYIYGVQRFTGTRVAERLRNSKPVTRRYRDVSMLGFSFRKKIISDRSDAVFFLSDVSRSNTCGKLRLYRNY